MNEKRGGRSLHDFIMREAASTGQLKDKPPTPAQRAMLRFYESRGPTAQSDATGTMNTWRALITRGWLRRSHGLGTIETEITPAGRAALSKDEG